MMTLAILSFTALISLHPYFLLQRRGKSTIPPFVIPTYGLYIVPCFFALSLSRHCTHVVLRPTKFSTPDLSASSAYVVRCVCLIYLYLYLDSCLPPLHPTVLFILLFTFPRSLTLFPLISFYACVYLVVSDRQCRMSTRFTARILLCWMHGSSV